MANTENKNIEEKEKSETPQPETKSETKTETSSKKENKKETNKKIEELQGKVKELEAKVDESKNDYLRLMAEFETYRRRTAEDRLNLVSSASADTIKGLLPVLDDCERAMAILSDSSDEAAKEGTELIFTKLMAFLKTKGLSVIEAKGEKFNVDFHEAVTQFPVADEAQKGMVIDVTQTGYILNGKVLRYAKVVVGA
ncbi:MAG: nucleotide exchange factor GrpE [Bacteroidales bacterium]|nr:nucleotide exchange factor GrpE [Bacteroidales bacterium]